jgi:hypothetical protein
MNRTLTALACGLASAALLTAQTPPAPPVSLSLGARQARATPIRVGCTHTGGGNCDVQQPSPDAVVVTLTGVAVAGPHPCKASSASLLFEVTQEFDVSFDKPDVKRAKLQLEGRLIGLLRSHEKGGSAEASQGCVSVRCGDNVLLSLTLPSHAVAGGENLSVNDRPAPVSATVAAGSYVLHETFAVSASHGRGLCSKAASAEFAPDPALDPLWISAFEPFHGANKKDFGLQVTLKVSAEANEQGAEPKNGKAGEGAGKAAEKNAK